jgi:hypothetical protein
LRGCLHLRRVRVRRCVLRRPLRRVRLRVLQVATNKRTGAEASRSSIHRSAWKGDSPNFALTAFSEVAPALLRLHTGLADQLKARPTGPALYAKEVG